jgi:hypothetical protein
VLAAATYDPTLLWLGVGLTILGLLVQAVIWLVARSRAKGAGAGRTEDWAEKVIELLIKLIEKGLIGVAITAVGLILIVVSVTQGDSSNGGGSTTTATTSG